MNQLGRQKGVSVIVVLMVLALTIFSANFIVRIAAMKWDNYVVTTVLADLGSDIAPNMREKDIRKLVDGRLDINNLNFISKKDLRIVKKKGQISLFWPYERREHVMMNVDIVLNFNHEYSY